MDEHGHELQSFIVGALAGAAVGAALGILLAPRSGAETRKLITEKAAELKERGQQIARSREKPEQA